jgi:hypothetical protein
VFSFFSFCFLLLSLPSSSLVIFSSLLFSDPFTPFPSSLTPSFSSNLRKKEGMCFVSIWFEDIEKGGYTYNNINR